MALKAMTTEEVLSIHRALVDAFADGGDPISPSGTRPDGLLESSVSRPGTSLGKVEKYKSVELKAAALFHSLVGNHPFFNGNKRTAVVSMLVYLDRNNRRITVNDDELFEFVLRVANRQGEGSGTPDAAVDAIAEWIKAHCPPGQTRPSGMKTTDFLESCRRADCKTKVAAGGQSWVVRGPNGKSIRVGRDSRQLDGNVVRSWVKKLGLTMAASGLHLDEFQAGVEAEQDFILPV
jgi:death on curing protein